MHNEKKHNIGIIDISMKRKKTSTPVDEDSGVWVPCPRDSTHQPPPNF